MQLILLENSDEIAEMENRSGSPSIPWSSTSCLDSSDSPRVLPRIGDKYQAEVPPFVTRRDWYLQDKSESMDSEKSQDENYEKLFAEGLPVPLMQIPCFSSILDVKDSDINHVNRQSLDNAPGAKELGFAVAKTEYKLCQHGQLEDKSCIQQLNFIGSIQFTHDNGDSSMTDTKREFLRAEGEIESDFMDSTIAVDSMPDTLSSGRGRRRRRGKAGWKRVKKAKADFLKVEKQRSDFYVHTQHPHLCATGEDVNSRRYTMVPGSPSEAWTEIEEDIFLLGLYIFGKNFVPIKSFMETKKMTDILSHYYGKFFRTETYCRWAESRKIRSRKCFQGQRIFSGWRQQELSTRLLPHITEHLKHKVPEVMKAFTDGRISIEEFVMELKALVGLEVLVQAVGIGKGNHDLTAAIMDPTKTNQVASTRFEIPMGRACSSLSTEEIVKFLTGDYRISKARANDLFWEAVWPRLLARGWHSEQPDDQATFGLRPLLVFLIPSVQKFSRRNLVKGIHYFDSVSEVLSKVASQPRLIDPPELEVGEVLEQKVKIECLWTSENTEGKNDQSRDSHCYLRPRHHTNEFESFVFTVVDTSLLSQREEPARFRESRALPADDSSECLETDSGEIEYGDDSEFLLNKKVEIGENLRARVSLNSDPAEASPIVINDENLGGYNMVSGLFMASPPSYASVCPCSQAQHENHCGTGLRLQFNCLSSTSETNTVEDRTWERSTEERCYRPLNPNSEVIKHAGQCKKASVLWDDLCFPLKQRSLSMCNYGETRDDQLIKSSNTKEHGLASSSLLVKFDAKKQTPMTFLENSTSERSICIPSLIKVLQEKSERDFSTLLRGSWFSFNRISSNALYSRLCRMKPRNANDLTLPQDHSGNLMPKSMAVIHAALLEPPKLVENFQSEQDFRHLEEQPTDSGQAQLSRPDRNLKDLKSEENSPPWQDSGNAQEQTNDSGQALSASLVPILHASTYEKNSESEQHSGHPQEQPKDSGQIHSTTGPCKGKPGEPQGNNVHGFPAEVRRQSTRIRPLTMRALEAFACGFYTARRRKGGRSITNSDTSHPRSFSRQVPDDPACLLNGSSLDNNDITVVDTSMESMDGEGNIDAQVGGKPRRGYKRRRTHALTKISSTGLYAENPGQEKREDVVAGMLVSEVGN